MNISFEEVPSNHSVLESEEQKLQYETIEFKHF